MRARHPLVLQPRPLRHIRPVPPVRLPRRPPRTSYDNGRVVKRTHRATRSRLDPLWDAAVDVILAALTVRDVILDRLLGPRCAYGCGQRLYPRDIALHEHYDHAGDTRA